MAGEGIELVKPSSVTVSNGSASITTLGAVNVTSASVVFIEGVFSSRHDNYHVVMRNTTNGNGANARYRLGGSSASAADYNLITTQVNGSHTPTGSQTLGALSFQIASTDAQGIAETYIFGPALAQPTTQWNWGGREGGGSFALIQNASSVHTLSTAYDGLQISYSANVTFQVAIYGLED